MRNSYGFLIRFIDLGLLLLAAFLITADLSQRIQVGLPQSGEEGGAVMAEAVRIQFDEVLVQVWREPAGEIVCQDIPLEQLAGCLRLLEELPGPRLLTPVGVATVQRPVDVMDVCQQERIVCSIAPMQP